MTETRHHGGPLDFAGEMSRGDDLHLDAVLNAQHPLSPDRNQMLFIVRHQTSGRPASPVAPE